LKCLALLENVIGSRKHETVEEEVRKEEEDWAGWRDKESGRAGGTYFVLHIVSGGS
jgi:hypothetical protein